MNIIPRPPFLAASNNEGLCQSREVGIQVFLALLLYFGRKIILAFYPIELYVPSMDRFTLIYILRSNRFYLSDVSIT